MRNIAWAPALLLFSLVTISHVILPSLSKNEILPFFTWRLFDSHREDPFYDLKIEKGGQSFFLTNSSENQIPFSVRHTLWFLVNQNEDPNRGNHDKIRHQLSELNLRFVSRCKIQSPLENYVLSDHKESMVSCEDLD